MIIPPSASKWHTLHHKKWVTAARWMFLLILVYLGMEFIALLGISLLSVARGISAAPSLFQLSEYHRLLIHRWALGEAPNDHIMFDPNLGWTVQPSRGFVWKDAKVTVNAQGIRSERTYGSSAASGVFRIAAFGDSFTFGNYVSDDEAWAAKLETFLPQTEVLNFGVPGYGIDQAYLRYLTTGASYQPDLVLIGMMSEDIRRGVSVFQPFLAPDLGIPLSKPRYKLRDDTLVLLENPLRDRRQYKMLLEQEEEVLRKLGENDYYFHTTVFRGSFDVFPMVRFAKVAWKKVILSRLVGGEPVRHRIYNIRSEAFELLVATTEEFVRAIRSNGAEPLVLLFPSEWNVEHFRKNGERMYGPLISSLQERGIPFVDFLEAFERFGAEAPLSEYFAPDKHYSARGNAVVARYLADVLKDRVP